MRTEFRSSAAPLITTIQKLFSEDLAKENDFLRHKNEILRSKLGKRVSLTEADRRMLVRYGLRLKDRLAEVISIVRPETLLAWNRRMKRQKWTFDNTPKRPGRPSTAKATEELVLRLAEENAWGYVRIAGGLKKLGHEISPSCVRDLMRKHGLPPCRFTGWASESLLLGEVGSVRRMCSYRLQEYLLLKRSAAGFQFIRL